MRYAITGGGGFVGTALSRLLVAEGHEVCSVSRGVYPHLSVLGVKQVRADIAADYPAMESAFNGVQTVFHTAALVEMWGDRQKFIDVNLTGTRNVIKACQAAGVRQLVFTSSPSVIADGTDLRNIDESYPYPAHYEAYYPETKAAAEREVLAANGEKLKTAALRPHLIFGPGDTNLIPTIVEAARAGKLLRIGQGRNMVDFTYIDDCVQAHLLAARALEMSGDAAGKAYFISQGEPYSLWGWIDEILIGHGLPKVTRYLPRKAALGIAAVAETVCSVLPGKPVPVLTRFLVNEMATDHYFNIGRAQTLLGYKPQFSMKAALAATLASVYR